MAKFFKKTVFSLLIITLLASCESGSLGGIDYTAESGKIVQGFTTDDSVVLSWESVKESDAYYHIYKAEQDFSDASGSAKSVTGFKHIASIQNTTVTASEQLITGRNYYFKVFATDSSITSDSALKALNADSDLILRVYNSIKILLVPAIANLELVSTQQATSINLKWNVVDGADSYKVYQSLNSFTETSDNGVDLIASEIKETSYTVPNLSSATKYYFRVVATNSVGDGEESNEVNGTTSISYPENLSLTAKSESSITASWDAVTGAIKYKVYYHTSTIDDEGTGASTLETSNTTLDLTGLSANVLYYVRVSAIDADDDEGVLSEEKSSTTKPAQVMNVVVNGVDSTSVLVNWDAVTGADSYKIYHAYSTIDDVGQATELTTSESNIKLSNLNTGVLIYIKVLAVSSSGEGLLSMEATGFTAVDPKVKVTNLAVNVENVVGSLVVTWTRYDDTGVEVTGYKVYKNTSSTVDNSHLVNTITGNVEGTSNKYVDENLDSGTTYYYKVIPTTSTGDGVLSVITEESETTLAPKIEGVYLIEKSDTSLTVRASPEKGAISYTYYYKLEGSPTTSDSNVQTAKGKNTEVKIPGLESGKLYKIKVVATYPNASSEISQDELEEYTYFSDITGVSASTVSTHEIRISWTQLDTHTDYYVYKSVDEEFAEDEKVEETISGDASHLDTELVAGKKYYYKVIAYNDHTRSNLTSATQVEGYTNLAKVENVLAKAQTDTQINVVWNKLDLETKYYVYRSKDTDFAESEKVLVSLTGTSGIYQHTDLKSNTPYYYKVVAFNDNTVGVLSEADEVMDTTKLSAPKGVHITPVSTSSLNVTWNAIANVNAYKVYYSTSPINDITGATSKNSSANSILIDNLIAGTDYYVKVTAVSDASIEGAFSTTIDPVPTKVEQIINLSASPESNSASLSWDSVTGADSYKIYYFTSTFSSTDDLRLSSTTVSTTSVIIRNLKESTLYYYGVTAVNSISGEGALSEVAQVTTKLSAPTEVRITPVSTSSLNVTWKAVVNVATYNVYYSTSPFNDATTGVSNKITNTNSISIDGLDSGTGYYVKVVAVSSESIAGDSSKLVGAVPTKVEQVTNVSASSESKSISLNWDSVKGATSYKIYYHTSTFSSTTDVGLSSTTVSTTSVVIRNLDVSTLYYYGVTAVNSISGEGALSTIADITTKLSAPTEVRITPVSTISLNVTWKAVVNAATYNVYYSTSPFNDATIGVSNKIINTNSISIGGLDSGTGYYVKVVAVSSESIAGDSSKLVGAVPTKVERVVGLTTEEILANSIDLSWDSVRGANSYKIYYHTSTFSSTTDIGLSVTTVSTNSEIIKNLNVSTLYYYAVTAINSISGEGALSEVSNSTTKLPAPTEVRITPVSTSSLSVKWNAITNVAGYRLYYSTSPIDDLTTAINTSTVSASILLEGLTPGTAYYVKVAAISDTSREGDVSEMAGPVFTKVAQVTNIVVNSAHANSINLSWDSIAGANNYKIYYHTITFSATTQIGLSSTIVGTNSGVIRNLKVSTLYYYAVTGINNSSGEGELSTVDSTMTLITAPTGVNITTQSTNSLKVTWNAINEASAYIVYYGTTLVSDGVTGLTASTTNNASMLLEGLNPGTEYYVKLKVSHIGGNPVLGNLSKANNSAFTKVERATRLVTESITANSINLNWDSVTGANSYKIYYHTSTFSSTTDLGLSSTTASTDKGVILSLDAETLYYYAVTGINNSSGEGQLSTIQSATTLLSAPTGLSVTKKGTDNLEVSWDVVDNVSSYVLYYSAISSIADDLTVMSTVITNNASPVITTNDASFTVVTNNATALIEDLTSNTQYYIRLQVAETEDSTALSDLSDEIDAYTLITAPASIEVYPVSDTSIIINWSPVMGATDYKLCYDIDGNPVATQCTISTNGQNTHTHTVNSNTEYHYKVLAVGTVPPKATAGDDGVLSTTVATLTSFMSGNTVENLIQDTTVDKVKSGEVTLNWDAYTGAIGYNLYVESQQATSITTVTALSSKIVLGNITSYTLTGLDSNNPYGFSMQAVTNNGTTNLSSAIITAPLPTTIALGRNTVAGSSTVYISYPGTNITLHRSETADCDLTNTTGCTNYYSKIITSQGMGFVNSYDDSKTHYYKLESYSSSTNSVQIDTTATSRFSARYQHQTVVWKNKLYVIGGGFNDVWSSANGVNWTEVKANNFEGFSARYQHQTVVWKNELYLIGGGGNEIYKNDVWKSADGVSWTEIKANNLQGFPARSGFQVVVWNDELYLTGGASASYKNDVWKSADGLNWTEVKANNSDGFPARIGHQMVVWNDELYIMGGYDSALRNDVWKSTDGVNWTEVKANNFEGFSARYQHQMIVWQDEFYIIGGFDNSSMDASALRNDVWKSADGITWTEVKANNSEGFSARDQHQTVVWNDELYLIGGDINLGKVQQNDIWKSTDGVNWFEMFSTQSITW